MSQRIAVYPGTFNPITNGHVDIITRALGLFDGVIVAVAGSDRKPSYLSLDERVTLTTQTLAHHKTVRVEKLDGLLVDFAKAQGVEFILRGLRAVSDFDYEFQLAGMNRKMAPKIETIFLPAAESHSFISATMVREIASLGGDVSPFVPSPVAEYLQSK